MRSVKDSNVFFQRKALQEIKKGCTIYWGTYTGIDWKKPCSFYGEFWLLYRDLIKVYQLVMKKIFVKSRVYILEVLKYFFRIVEYRIH